MKREAAETVALRALAWLAANDDLLPVFLGASGASLADLKAAADQPEVLASILDFLCMDDAWVVGFCDAAGLPYDAPARARQLLPGGAQPNWT